MTDKEIEQMRERFMAKESDTPSLRPPYISGPLPLAKGGANKSECRCHAVQRAPIQPQHDYLISFCFGLGLGLVLALSIVQLVLILRR